MSSKNDEVIRYGMDFIDFLCKTHGPRITSTPEEVAAAKDLKQKLEDTCDDTYLDEFELYPNLYPQGFVKIAATLILIGVPFMFFGFSLPILSTIFVLAAFIQLFLTYMKMSEIFGIFFKKRKSYNATGRIYPRNEKGEITEAKKRVVLAGHIDSAYKFAITDHGDNLYKFAAPGFIYILCQFFFGIIKTIVINVGNPRIFAEGGGFLITTVDIIFICIAAIGLPGLYTLYKGLTGGTPVEGANDNLSGVGIALAIAKYFSMPENRLKNVELWVGGFGSEECGERGAQAFIVKYGPQGLLDDAYNIIPESCGAGDRIAIITKEPIHLAKHDLKLCNTIYETGYKDYIKKEELKDPIPCTVMKLPMSASDAGRFSLAGYKASMIIAFEGALSKPKNWHHELDIPENLEFDMIKTVFGIYKHYILNLEKSLSE